MLNICCSLLPFVQAMQNGWNFWELLLRPLPKFDCQVQKIFWTQPFGLDQILFHFNLFVNKIFRSAWILQLPTRYYEQLTKLYPSYLLFSIWVDTSKRLKKIVSTFFFQLSVECFAFAVLLMSLYFFTGHVDRSQGQMSLNLFRSSAQGLMS